MRDPGVPFVDLSGLAVPSCRIALADIKRVKRAPVAAILPSIPHPVELSCPVFGLGFHYLAFETR